MNDPPGLPRPLWSGTQPVDWTADEWQVVLDANALAPVRGEWLLALYRQWRWAHYQCGRYATELVKRRRREKAGVPFGWHDPDEDQVFVEPGWFGIDLEEPEWAAHYAWMAFLQSVIEGLERREVALPGRLAEDQERVREILREQRNAVMHPAEKPFWDNRLVRLWYEDEEANDSIMALHVGIGAMIIAELQLRDAVDMNGPDDTRLVP